MAHAIIRVGYTKYVLPVETAVTVAQALADAERYESIYIPTTERPQGGADYTHHIFSNPENVAIELISEDKYRIAKMAGKPNKDQ